MRTVSDAHESLIWKPDLREGRIRKCVSIISGLPVGTVLDIGCATGDWAKYWMERGWQCLGLDINTESVELSAAKGIDARLCDLNKEPIPFPDACADLVFAGEVIEHLVDTDGFLREVRRCLKPGGHLLLTTPNLASLENRLRLALGFYPMWMNYSLEGACHIRAYNPRVLKKQLRAHGFSIVKFTGNWVPFIPQRYLDDIKMPILSITGTLFPNLAMDMIVLARTL